MELKMMLGLWAQINEAQKAKKLEEVYWYSEENRFVIPIFLENGMARLKDYFNSTTPEGYVSKKAIITLNEYLTVNFSKINNLTQEKVSEKSEKSQEKVSSKSNESQAKVSEESDESQDEVSDNSDDFKQFLNPAINALLESIYNLAYEVKLTKSKKIKAQVDNLLQQAEIDAINNKAEALLEHKKWLSRTLTYQGGAHKNRNTYMEKVEKEQRNNSIKTFLGTALALTVSVALLYSFVYKPMFANQAAETLAISDSKENLSVQVSAIRTESEILEAIKIYQESTGLTFTKWRKDEILKKALNSSVPVYLVIDSINTKHPIKNI